MATIDLDYGNRFERVDPSSKNDVPMATCRVYLGGVKADAGVVSVTRRKIDRMSDCHVSLI